MVMALGWDAIYIATASQKSHLTPLQQPTNSKMHGFVLFCFQKFFLSPFFTPLPPPTPSLPSFLFSMKKGNKILLI